MLCSICKKSTFTFIPYSNDLRIFKPVFIKHYILYYILKILKFLRLHLPSLESKILFFPKFKTSVCQSCGYGYYTKNLTHEQLSLYYKKYYWHSNATSYFDKKEFLKNTLAIEQFEFINPLISKPKQLLEIGCAAAFFTQYYRFKYPTVSCHIIESGLNWKSYHHDSHIPIVADYFPSKLTSRYDYIHM